MRIRWTPELVLQKIKERQAQNLPLNYSAVVADDERLTGAARRYHGNWNGALISAGIDPETVRYPRSDSAPRGTWTQDVIIEEIQKHATNGVDLAAHRMRTTDPKLLAAATHHFGSWRDAVSAAGYDYDLIRLTREWDADRIIRRLKQLSKDGADLSVRSVEAWDPGLA